MKPLRILDTTLRDGDQAAGFAFCCKKKAELALLLAEAGADIVETGFPSSSPQDKQACIESAAALRGTSAAVAMMCRAKSEEIRETASILPENGILHLTLPVSDEHREALLGISRTKLLAQAKELISFAAGYAVVEAGCEDASCAESNFLHEYIGTVLEAGAGIVNYADTRGVLCPPQVKAAVESLNRQFPQFSTGEKVLSVHFHNDYGLATANTLTAVQSGCGQAEMTVSGIGERAGNASLEETAANLFAHAGIYQTVTNIKPEKLPELTRRFRKEAVLPATPLSPLCGWNVNTHSAGIHQKGIEYSPDSYDSVTKNPPHIVLSRHSGKSGIRLAAKQYGVAEISERQLETLFQFVKQTNTGTVSAARFFEQLRKLGLLKEPLQQESGIKWQTVQTVGIDGHYRMYAEGLLSNGTVYRTEHSGSEPETLLKEIKQEAALLVRWMFRGGSSSFFSGEKR
ncbi:MAG: LeuA family protein [Planctomycetaceae bacterium]|jgi:2-isopropylmalate synthase|nr:LeuA family protein [Planctomycetaceae bacterium]